MGMVTRGAWLLFVFGLGCARGKPATDDSATAAMVVQEGLTHLQMYAMDTAMALDQAVLSELAADPSVLLPEGTGQGTPIDRAALRRKLARDGYPVGEERLGAALAVFRATARSSVTGDDQALVVAAGGTYRYGPTVHVAVPVRLVNERTFTNGKFHWVATLANQTTSEGYSDLKIDPGVSACLYAGKSATNSFVAYWYKPDVALGCDGTGELDESALDPALRLAVLRTAPSEAGQDFDDGDVPEATRIEWGTNQVQMIGVKCGGEWCQVAPLGTTRADLEPMPSVPANMDREDRRNRRMKGRFDYQMLADKRPDGTLVPSGILARLLPRKRQSMENPGPGPYEVAQVVLDVGTRSLPQKYANQGFADGTNTLTFCRSTYQNCGGTQQPSPAACDGTETLWGRVITEDGRAGPVFPVCYLKSTSPVNLWITRWNWLPQDEGFWVRCLNGCCTPKL